MVRVARVVLTNLDGGIGTIVLNRPEVHNAITVELAQSLVNGLAAFANRANVIVIRGAGGNFSVGGDFTQLEQLRMQGGNAMLELLEAFQHACACIASLPVPVIAAVEGYAMAGGFELMQACDFALVRSDATIADNHSNFGQIPAGGGSQRLPRIIGRQRALGLILTGDRISGEEAVHLGLAYRSFAPEQFHEGVEEVARRLASKPRETLARCKRLVYAGLEQDIETGIDLELRTALEHLESDIAARGIESFSRR